MDNIANKVLDIVYFVSESKSRKVNINKIYVFNYFY